MSSADFRPFSRPVQPSTVRAPQHIRIEALSDERAIIARALDLGSVDELKADLEIRPWRARGVRVNGTVSARVGQTCTVTFEPMTAEVHEIVEERFMPAESVRPAREEVVDIESTEDCETFEDDSLDLGMLVFEYLAMGIDPYPRLPDAEVGDTAGPNAPDGGRNSPFAGLGGLLRRDDERDDREGGEGEGG